METVYNKKDQKPINGEVKASYFGVDLHKDQITWHCIMLMTNGELVRTTGVTSTDCITTDFVSMLTKNNSYVIVEASGSTFFFHSLVSAHCTKAIVINPLAFREMYMTGKKTDKVDAKKLADRLMYHIEMGDADDGFPEVFVPDAEAQMVRKLVAAYDSTVKKITQCKNRIKAILRGKIINTIGDTVVNYMEKVLEHPRLDQADRIMMKALKAEYDTLCTQKEALKDAIQEIGVKRFHAEIKVLISVAGVGILGACVFMSDIISVDRFKSVKHMTSYLSSVGKVDSSGNTTRNGGLNKRGRKASYRFILQGLEHIVNSNVMLQAFKERHKGTKTNKVRAAEVRKTFVAMYFMLKNNEPYRYTNKSLHNKKIVEVNKIYEKAA